MKPPTICYLAPELTALEATFVYDELLALELRGWNIVPVSVRRPKKQLIGHDDLLKRTFYLYDVSKVLTVAKVMVSFFRIGKKHLKAIRFLISDMSEIGFYKAQSWKLLFQYLVASELAEIMINKECKLLHIHFAHVSAQIGMYASAMSAVPFTIMAHANDIFERGILLNRKAERSVKLLTISEFNLAYLERIGVPKEKISIVRCGVGFDAAESKRSFNHKASYRIGTLGRLVEKKGFDVLIRALAFLSGTPYEVHLSIAGDGPLREELESLVVEMGLCDQVEFIGGLSHADVVPWIQGLDIFVLACKQDRNGDMDGIPVSLMEAMSQSVAVVSTRLSGIPELIIHESTGLLAEPNDAEDLAKQINRLLLLPEFRETLATKALQHVNQEFGQQVNLDRLVDAWGKSLPVS